MLFLSSSKHALRRLASSLVIPCMMSCFSKALLVFRTRVPRVIYIQERLRDMRTKYGVERIRLVNVDAAFIFVRLDME